MTNDLISRSALKKTFCEACMQHRGIKKCEISYDFCDAMKHIDTAPVADAFTIEDLQEAFNDGVENERAYHWGSHIRKPWYMRGDKREDD